MILHRLVRMNKNQRGFSLVEMVIAIAIAALVAGGVGMAVFQVFVVNAGSSARMTAVKEVENAIHWITIDAQMAQYSENATAIGTGPFPVTLRWANKYDSPSISANVTYTISGGQLQRTYSSNVTSSMTSVIAGHIDSNAANTNWSFSGGSSGSVLTFKITASVGGFRPASETRSFDIVTRSVP